MIKKKEPKVSSREKKIKRSKEPKYFKSDLIKTEWILKRKKEEEEHLKSMK